MSTISLEGACIVGPGTCGGSCSGGEATVSFSIGLCPNPKPSGARFFGRPTINSPSAYIALPGIGAAPNVTAVNFLHLRVTNTFKVRLTQLDPEGGADIVSILNVGGEFDIEFPATGTCKLVEVKGAGTVEYLASGML